MAGLMTVRPVGRVVLLAAVLGLVAGASPAVAGGGQVLPAKAKPKGYSLTDMAKATAVFNTGSRAADTLPDVPFQILYIPPGESTNTFVVKPGTMFYVPIFYSNDSPPTLGDIPDVTDPDEVAHYYFDQSQLGVTVLEVEVDGEVTELGPEYTAGAITPPLPDGGGTRYTTAAVFLTPLSKGRHTVTIRMEMTGDALDEYPEFFPDGTASFEATYTVIVK
jgi:hypothetical protein